MEPDAEDRAILKVLALAAAVIVNAGNGAPPEGIIAQADQYEAHLAPYLTEAGGEQA